MATPSLVTVVLNILKKTGRWVVFRHLVAVSPWLVRYAHKKGFPSIAFPLVGAGSGGFNQDRTRTIMEDELRKMEYQLEVTIIIFRTPNASNPNRSHL